MIFLYLKKKKLMMTKKNKISCIYKIICKNNNKFYIGSSVNINRRLKDHIRLLNKNKHNNIHLQRAWNKYGEQNFRFEIIETVNDINQLLIKEKWWIENTKCYDRKIGFNIATDTFAPMRDKKHSEKTKQKMKISRKKQIITQEHKNNISLGNLGRKVSEETIQKIVFANRGKKRSREQKENISRGHIGIIPSGETRLKLSLAHKKYYSIKENRDKAGKHRIGKALSEETKRKISDANKGKSRNFQQPNKKGIITNIIPELKILCGSGENLYNISKNINISMPTLTKWLKILNPSLYKLFQINGKKKMGINGFKTNNYNKRRLNKES